MSGVTAHASPDVAFRPVGELVLKGKVEGVEVFEPLSEAARDAPTTRQYLDAFERLRDDSDGARDLFEDLARTAPDDPLAKLHLERLQRGETGTRIVMDEK